MPVGEALVTAASTLAEALHDGQKYGEKDYAAHLADVVALLRGHGFQRDYELLAAAWLHDSIEDGKTGQLEIGDKVGDGVARLVWAVTGHGRNRRERNADAYAKILFCGDRAIALKLADRAANVLSCWETRDTRLFMYQREYREFREKLRIGAVKERELKLWDKLDKLLGWYEPKRGG